MIWRWALIATTLLALPESLGAGGRAKEVAEFIVKKFGKEAVKDGAVALAGRIEGLATKHGPEVYQAVRKVGPGAIHLLEQAGPHGITAAQVLAKFGDDAAVIAARPQALALVAKHGDEATRVLLKHKGIAEPILEKFGQPGVEALAQLNKQNGRRLAMLLEEGALAKTGKAEEVLRVIGKYGDRAMTFVWDNKGPLAMTAVLTAFIARPELFISGAVDITKVVGDSVAKPIAEVPGKFAVEVGRGTNWTVVLLVLIVLSVGFWGIPRFLKRYGRKMPG
jgi:hypothetical protein